MNEPKTITPITMSDLGIKGGRSNAARHSHEHFVEMGKAGADARKKARAIEAQFIDGPPPRKRPVMGEQPKEPRQLLTPSEAGARGGARTLERKGREFYKAIGAKGGARVKEAFKANYRAALAAMVGHVRAALTADDAGAPVRPALLAAERVFIEAWKEP